MRQGISANFQYVRPSGFTLDVDLTLPDGQTTALLGPNGSGKSTLVDVLAGHLRVTNGTIRIGDRLVDDAGSSTFVRPEERKLGIVHQRYLLFEHLTVEDNIAFANSVRGQSRSESRRAAAEWIEALDLTALAQRRPSQLSGGQQQRVALGRALASEPTALFLDEPLSALDVQAKAALRPLLKKVLAEFRGPRLIITHDPIDAKFFADRVLILEDGMLTQGGSLLEVAARPQSAYAAALAGVNLLMGSNDAGTVTVDGTTAPLTTSNSTTSGAVLITIKPTAVALHSKEPAGSSRNRWQTTIATVEELGEITRVTLAEPFRLNVDVTPAAADSMNLQSGSTVWAAVKATEVHVYPN